MLAVRVLRALVRLLQLLLDILRGVCGRLLLRCHRARHSMFRLMGEEPAGGIEVPRWHTVCMRLCTISVVFDDQGSSDWRKAFCW